MDKLPLWADVLLTVWVAGVAAVYFGGFFVPAIGAYTGNATALYALMLLVSVIFLALRFLHRGESLPMPQEAKPKRDVRAKKR